jgi:hypothetical protein
MAYRKWIDGKLYTDRDVGRWLSHAYATDFSSLPEDHETSPETKHEMRLRFERECWREAYNTAAQAEGWGVFNGCEIQRDDDRDVFASDDEAIAHVRELADAGSAFHRAAIRLHGAPDDDDQDSGEPQPAAVDKTPKCCAGAVIDSHAEAGFTTYSCSRCSHRWSIPADRPLADLQKARAIASAFMAASEAERADNIDTGDVLGEIVDVLLPRGAAAEHCPRCDVAHVTGATHCVHCAGSMDGAG